MKLLNFSIWAAELIGCFFLIAGFLWKERWGIIPIIVFLLIVFTIGWIYHWKWVASVNLFCMAILAGAGGFLGINPLFLGISLSLNLAVWDLLYYRWQSALSNRIEDQTIQMRSHLIYLGLVIIISILTIEFSHLIQIRLSLGITILLGMIAIFGLYKAVRFIRRLEM